MHTDAIKQNLIPAELTREQINYVYTNEADVLTIAMLNQIAIIKILTPKNDIIFRFVFYAMKCILYNPQDHARQWISTYSKFQIPIPPLPIQQEMVNILDKFTSLEARRKQYEYYRNKLLLSSGDRKSTRLNSSH